MASRYNNNDDGTPLLVCPQRAGKMEQMYGPPLCSQNRYDRRDASFITLPLGINQCTIYASRKTLSTIISPLFHSTTVLKMILILRRIELFKTLNMLCLEERFQQSLKLIKEQDFSLTRRKEKSFQFPTGSEKHSLSTE